MKRDRLDLILARYPDITVLVLGDFFLDKYLIVDPALGEVSLETGLTAHQVTAVRCQPGAAGTVTANLRAMGVGVVGLGVVGDDGEGFELLRGLDEIGVDVEPLVIRADRMTPTYTKPLSQTATGVSELNRLDIKNRTPMTADIEDAVIHQLREVLPRVHGVIVADQVTEACCGVITDRVREELAVLARAHPAVPILVDSRERIGLFEDIILKPNAREAVRAIDPAARWLGSPDPDPAQDWDLIEAAGSALYRRTGRPVFLTLGSGGILAFHPDGPTHVPAVPLSGPLDIVGAGDSAMAGMAAALCAGATVPEAAEIACLAAAVTVRQIGTTGTASRRQILETYHARAGGE